jgi:hypothetical protein
MADWNTPVGTTAYTSVLINLKERDDALAKGLDPATIGTFTNIPTNALRWNSANNYWEKFNGTSWVALSAAYGISITGNAATATKLTTARTFTLTGDVTGSGTTAFDGSGNIIITTSINGGTY